MNTQVIPLFISTDNLAILCLNHAWNTGGRHRKGLTMNGFDTVREFAERIGVSTKTVYRMIEDGQLKAARVRNVLRINVAASLKMLGLE